MSRTTASWNGSPIVLQVDESVTLPQMPNGIVILAALNTSTNDGAATLSVTIGSGAPQKIPLPAGSTLPWVEVIDGQANQLQITNTSSSALVEVQLIGPGLPGYTPKELPDNSPVVLDAGGVAEGSAASRETQLKIQAGTTNAAAVGVIGGPNANEITGRVIAVNAPSSSPPQGYYAATTANTYTLTLNWDTGTIFVANLSSSPAVTVTLRSL
jgi:hypothetical protein